MIKLIHRIWIGSEMPDEYREFGRQFDAMNPGWAVIDWDQQMIDNHKWHNQAVLDHLKETSERPDADMAAYYTQVADVLDYEILLNYGGWYFNTDIKPIKPLEVLFDREPGLEAFCAAGMEDEFWPVNAAMWAPTEGQALYRNAVNLLPGRYFGHPGAFMNFSTGPHLLKAAVDVTPGVILLHRDTFNPIHWSEFDYGTTPDYLNIEYPEATIATHIWAHRTTQRNQRVVENP